MSDSWQKIRLADLCKIEKSKNNGSALPYVGMEHIESNILNPTLASSSERQSLFL